MQPESDLRDWEILNTVSMLEHPYVTVAMEEVRLPDGEIVPDWPKIHTQDYVNVVVINKANEALILEGYKHGAGRTTWQLLAASLEANGDPLTVAQRELIEGTGHETSDWSYLGSFVVDPNRHVGIGHFFCAQGVASVSSSDIKNLSDHNLKWVSLQELRYALLDGRLAAMSYATAVSLALLTVLK